MIDYQGFLSYLRRVRDSNPRRCYPQRFSRPPQSTALPTLRRKDTKKAILPLKKIKLK